MWFDALIGLVWLFVTAGLVGAAWLWVKELFPHDNPFARTMHTVVLVWAAVVGMSISLGTLGILSGWFLLSVGALLSLTAIVIHWRRRGIPQVACEPRTMAASAWTWVWLSLLAFALVQVTFNGLTRFPMDWDTLTYHLPLVVQWLRVGSLYAPADAFWYNPGNNELWTLWQVAPFSGDFLHSFTNLPATILLACAAVELTQSSGASRAFANLAGVAVVSVWPVFRQLATTENDVAVAALFVASLAYIVRHLQGGQVMDLVWACASLGLLVGTKYYALGYAALAGGVLVGGAFFRRGLSACVHTGLAALVGCVLLGGYWYARNFLVAGSPTFPKSFTADTDLWAMMRPESWGSTLFGSGQVDVWPLAFEAVRAMLGICHVAALTAAPVSVLFLLITGYRLLRSATAQSVGLSRIVVAFCVPVSFLVLGFTPNVVEVQPGTMDMLYRGYLPARFSLCFLSLCVVVSAVAFSDLVRTIGHRSSGDTERKSWFAVASRKYVSIAVIALVAALCGWQLYNNWLRTLRTDAADRLLLAVDLLLVALLIQLVRELSVRLKAVLMSGAVLALLLGIAVGTAHLSSHWHERFAVHYSRMYSNSVLQIADKGHAPKLCVCDYRYYPFFGSRRDTWAHRPLWLPDAEALYDYLRRHSIELIVTLQADTYVQRRYVNVRQWLDDDPALFSLDWEDGKHALFRVNSGIWQRKPHSN
ncbi:MAG: hypothetical protein L0215_07450 [Gemmataceae bacterium]|nr:hypothetical protein [Gemmataceae bacterium]